MFAIQYFYSNTFFVDYGSCIGVLTFRCAAIPAGTSPLVHVCRFVVFRTDGLEAVTRL